MEISVALLLCLTFNYFPSRGFSVARGAVEIRAFVDESDSNENITLLSPNPSNQTAIEDQVIVENMTIVRASDFLSSEQNITASTDTNVVSSTSTIVFISENLIVNKNEMDASTWEELANEIITPKEASENSTLEELAITTTSLSNEIIVPKEAIDNSTLADLSTTTTPLENEIIVPKEAIDNSTLEELAIVTTPLKDEIIVPKEAVDNSTLVELALLEDEIIVPKETIDNSTLEQLAMITAPASVTNTTVFTTVDGNSDEIVVPKKEIDNSTLEELSITTLESPNTTASTAADTVIVNETQSTEGNSVTSETEEPNQGLGPISVHKRSIYPSVNSALFEKYEWSWPEAIASFEKKNRWSSQNRIRERRRKREDDIEIPFESQEDDNMENMDKHYKNYMKEEAVNSNSLEIKEISTSTEDSMSTVSSNLTETDGNSTNSSNVTVAAPSDNLDSADKQHLREDVVDEDDSVCAVNKDDEAATKMVTVFWRSVFCIIFVIIIVYPIYSYTKIYCQKRKRDTESISNERFIGSESETSNTTNDCPTSPNEKSSQRPNE